MFINIHRILAAMLVLIVTFMIVLDHFSGLPISTIGSQAVAFVLLIIIAIIGSIANHVEFMETGVKRQESWQFVLLFEMYILSLIVVLNQFGGESHIGFYPGSTVFWFAMGTAVVSTFFTYRRNQKAAVQ
ncbi:hypothetical protein [Salinicoccus hispanicus]|nr:hypothetical protein [Salinicoccus hispanicus]